MSSRVPLLNKRSPTVMLVAGEESGDRYAAELFRSLQKLIPDICAIGMGGQHMSNAGIDLRYNSSKISVIGIAEVFKHYSEIKRALNLMVQIACEEKPDLLICVDYKEFNIRLAKKVKSCEIKVLFYVSPQIWAWRPKRVKQYGDIVDMMAVIFPFEVPFYQRCNISVRYVGHPLAGRVYPTLTKKLAMERFDLDPSSPVLGFLPGSRDNEIKRLLPLMLNTAEILIKRFPDIQFVLFQASSIGDGLLDEYLSKTPIPVLVCKDETYDLIQCCDAIVSTSGTATLEAALLGIPMVITYQVNALTYLLGRCLIKIPHIGLPNIIRGKQIVQEYIQYEARPEKLSAEIERLLSDQNYADTMRSELAKVKDMLGNEGGFNKMAELVKEMLISVDNQTANS